MELERIALTDEYFIEKIVDEFYQRPDTGSTLAIHDAALGPGGRVAFTSMVR